MTDIRDAITALRTLLGALPEYELARWLPLDAHVFAEGDRNKVHWVADCGAIEGADELGEATAAYIATVASPDVTEALAQLLEAIDRLWTSDLVSPPVGEVLRTASVVAAAITRRSTT